MSIEAIGSFTLDAEVASEAIRYLLLNAGLGNGGNANIGNAVTSNNQTGVISAGNMTIGYLYEWMSVRFSNSPTGSANFSNNYANTSYIGLRNSNTQAVSENPADYVWTEVSPPFGTTYNPYYRTTGGRDFRFDVAANPPDSSWALIPTAPSNFIDLDKISGVVGSNGQSAFQGVAYKRSATQPTTPTTGTATFNFATGTFVPPTGWTTGIPADNGQPVWVTTTIFLANYQGTAIDEGWTTPQLGYQNGNAGTPGTSYYEFAAYTSSPPAAPPPTPTGGYWNFTTNMGGAPTSTGGFTWTTNPSNANVWASFALATTANGSNANSLSWSSPTLLAATGTAGADGLSTFQWGIYRQSNVGVPATPTGGTYRFGDPANSMLPTGWYSTAVGAVAAAGNGVVYASQGIASRQGTSGDSTNIISWSVPVQYLGENGVNGTPGISTYIWPIYQANLNAPATPTGGGPWNFTTANGSPPTNWYNSASNAWVDPVWVSETVVSSNGSYANVGTWSVPVRWSGPTGPAGANGANGSNGTNSYSFITDPTIAVIPATYAGVPTGNLPNVTLAVLNGANYVQVAGAGGANSNVLWTWDAANTGGGNTGVTIGNSITGLYQVQWPITNSSNVNSTIYISNVKVTTDGNIANGRVIGSVQIPVTQVRAGQSPGWYEVNVPNTTANSISTYTFPISGNNANVLTNAWRTQYNFGGTIYPANSTILKFNQNANVVGTFVQYTANSIYAQWDAGSNTYVGFTSITNGNTIIDGTLNTLNATVGNAISSVNFQPTTFANGNPNLTTAPQSGWSITKDGNLYAKNAFLDGSNISNVSASNISAGTITVIANVGNSITLDGANAIIKTVNPSNPNYFTILSGGNVTSYIPDSQSANGVHSYLSLTKVVSGQNVLNGVPVMLDGPWSTTPTILVSPSVLQTYSAGHPTQDQTLNLSANAIVPQTGKPGYWQFTPVATLTSSSNTGTITANTQQQSTTTNTITYNFTIPAGATGVSLNFNAGSYRGTTTGGIYNTRAISWALNVGANQVSNGSNTSVQSTNMNSWNSIPVNGSFGALGVSTSANVVFTYTDGTGTWGGASTTTTSVTSNFTLDPVADDGPWYAPENIIITSAWPFSSNTQTFNIPVPSGSYTPTSINVTGSYSNFQSFGSTERIWTSTSLGVWLGNSTNTYISGANISTSVVSNHQLNLSGSFSIPYNATTSGVPTKLTLTLPYANTFGTGGFGGGPWPPAGQIGNAVWTYRMDNLYTAVRKFKAFVTADVTWTAVGNTTPQNFSIFNSGSFTAANANQYAQGTLNYIAIGY